MVDNDDDVCAQEDLAAGAEERKRKVQTLERLKCKNENEAWAKEEVGVCCRAHQVCDLCMQPKLCTTPQFFLEGSQFEIHPQNWPSLFRRVDFD